MKTLYFSIAVSLTLTACAGVSSSPPFASLPTATPEQPTPTSLAYPVPTTMAYPVPTVESPSPTSMPSEETPTLAQTSGPGQCTPAESIWKQINSLRGFELSGGYADQEACSLWLVGEQLVPTRASVLVHSTDGGQSIQVAASFPFPDVFHLWRIGFTDKLTAWVVGDNGAGQWLLWESSDAGRNWEPVQLPAPLSGPEALAFSEGKVWIGANTGTNAAVFASGDGGKNWTPAAQFAPPSTSAQSRFSALAVSGSTLMAAWTDGAQNLVVVSQEGKDFQRVSDLADLTVVKEIALPDPGHAYLTGYFTATGRIEDGSAMLLRSTDGGRSWEKTPIPENPYTSGLLFSSTMQGYAISQEGSEIVILATEDGAQTWQTMPLKPAPMFLIERLFRAGDGTLYAVGLGGLYRMKP